jgi:hypothetical protein
VAVCDVSAQNCGLPGRVFAYDGTSFSTVVGVPEEVGEFIVFQGRLYYTEGDLWKYIEPAALADTGLGGGMMVSLSALGAAALALGLVGIAIARGRTSQNRRRHADL